MPLKPPTIHKRMAGSRIHQSDTRFTKEPAANLQQRRLRDKSVVYTGYEPDRGSQDAPESKEELLGKEQDSSTQKPEPVAALRAFVLQGVGATHRRSGILLCMYSSISHRNIWTGIARVNRCLLATSCACLAGANASRRSWHGSLGRLMSTSGFVTRLAHRSRPNL